MLDRQRVAEEVKGLEQPARATLRKYGVRFGAYHIYLPALLKPAPRALAAQLWALAERGTNQGRSTNFAARRLGPHLRSRSIAKSMRRSIAVAGYRVCGERAVRVDILERLADLIRPALAWREGAGTKPPGAVVGGGFTVVNGMTSLTGASGEDFASILRSLGYRMERRPKPPEPPPASEMTAGSAESVSEVAIGSQADATADTAAADIAAADTAAPGTADADAATASVAAAEPEVRDQIASGNSVEASEATGQSETAVAAPIEGSESIARPAPDDATAAQTIEAIYSKSSDVMASDPAADVAASESAAVAAEQAEPVMIEVWRPGRGEGGRRPRQKDRERRHHGRRHSPAATHRPQEPQVATAATAEPGAAAAEPDAAAAGVEPAQPSTPAREARPPRHRRRQAGEYRSDRPSRERDRPPVKRFERREKAPDPNSPFAKLAALKAQLEADAKERR